MTTFDALDWHLDAALERGRPPENAFTHIALYLAWLVRNELIEASAVPSALAFGVVAGGMTGSDLRDAVHDQLSSEVMTPEGADFTDWYYPQYLDDFSVAFAELGDYGVADTAEAYARIAPTIDRRHAEWLALGSPAGADVDAAPDPNGGALTFSADELGAMTSADLDAAAERLAAALAGDGRAAVEAAGADGAAGAQAAPAPHASPDLEALLPAAVGGVPMAIESSSAGDWGSSLLRQAIERVGGDVGESYVAVALGGTGEGSLAVTLYAIPGVPQDQLEAEFSHDAYLADGQHWARRDVDGKPVWWSSAEEFDTAFYALGGLVVTAGGSPARVREALEVLP